MKLKKLELYGFKSFARKTELFFDKGITAIIGPNGSGKSNVADAIRWVLGEQSAKSLRGARMEDVIFNGTDSRKAQGYCEVSLFFDNEDRFLEIDMDEVAVTRRVYRTGESEYFINSFPSRLKDIHELFRDTGIGKEGYSIIGQGRVEEILSNRSNERRNAFLEAAGVMKYRVRKDEAERKLISTRDNIVRIKDILDELEERLEPLRTESEKAREFLKLRDELKELELNLFLYQHDRTADKIKAADTVLKDMGEAIDELEREKRQRIDAMAQEEEREAEITGELSRLNIELMELTGGAGAASGDVKALFEKLEAQGRELVELEGRGDSTSKKQEELDTILESLVQQCAQIDDKLNLLEFEIAQKNNAVEAASAEATAMETTLDEKKARIISSMNRLSDSRSQISRLETLCENIKAQRTSIEARRDELSLEGAKLAAEKAQALENVSELEQELTSKRGALADKNNQYEAKRHESSKIDNSIMDQERELSAKKSRLKVLSDMKRDYEGYYTSVKKLLMDARSNSALNVLGVVAQIISCDKKYETAVEMSLGGALQHVVTPTEEDAKRIIEHLRNRKYGRATLLPITAMKSRTLDAYERRDIASVSGVIGVMSELLDFDPMYRPVIENLCGRTVVVEDMESGIALSRKCRASFKIATLRGDIFNPGGSMTGGSAQSREFSLLSRERELGDILRDIDKSKRELSELNVNRSVISNSIDELRRGIALAADIVSEATVALGSAKEKLSICLSYIEKNAQELAALDNELETLDDNMADIRKELESASICRQNIEDESTVTDSDIKQLSDALALARIHLKNVSDELVELKIEKTSLDKELQAGHTEQSRVSRERELLLKSASSDAQRMQTLKTDICELEKTLEQTKSNAAELEQRRHEKESEIEAAESRRVTIKASLDDARREIAQADSSREELLERHHKQELSKSRLELELTNMENRIMDEYQLSYDDVVTLRRPIVISQASLRIDELRTGIRSLGDVNVNAVEDFIAVSSRFDTMKTQYDDLVKAEADLNLLIYDLEKTIERDFNEQFKVIRDNFKQVFSELFGGGRAELLLKDDNDVLNCEIEIVAEPPGKKLSLLSLLSGGERALTAIALLFAMLKLKPTAFCILDEIETSLDEVNVTNFANYVRQYSGNTQFIMITHRKGSMEVCDSIYGIAMEEKGISKVVSARIA